MTRSFNYTLPQFPQNSGGNILDSFSKGFSLADDIIATRLKADEINLRREKQQQEIRQQQAMVELAGLVDKDPSLLPQMYATDPEKAKAIASGLQEKYKSQLAVLRPLLNADASRKQEMYNLLKPDIERAFPDMQFGDVYSNDLNQSLKSQNDILEGKIEKTLKLEDTAQGKVLFNPGTGDIIPTKFGVKQSADASSTGGATGAVVRQIMQDNPGMNFTQALQLYQTGFRQGTNIDPNTGKIVAQPGFTETIEDIEKSKSKGRKTGELLVDKEFTAPQAFSAMESAFAKSDNVIESIDNVIPRVNTLTAGFGGKQLSKISGTDALDLQRDIDTIIANLGFEELQEMRNNSKTGGALGNVVVKELELLQSVKANLQTDQSPAQLKKNLEKAKKLKIESDDRIKKAFEREYGKDTYKEFKKESFETSNNKPENDPLGLFQYE